MLRLALAATLMVSATAYSTSGDVMNLYAFFDTGPDASAAKCAANSDGTTAGTQVLLAGSAGAHTDLDGSRPIILGECYEVETASAAHTIAMNSEFDDATGNDTAVIAVGALSVSWAIDGGEVKMTHCDALACAGTCTTVQYSPTTDDLVDDLGWACTGATGTGTSALSAGIVKGTESDLGVNAGNYITVGVDSSHPAAAPGDCAALETSTTAPGKNLDRWPVAPDEATALPASTGQNDTRASFCYQSVATGAGSWQVVCDQETGNITRTGDANTVGCTSWSSADSVITFEKGDKCKNGPGGTGESWQILNSDTEWDAICKIPVHTGTAKYFNGYLAKNTATCATLTDTIAGTTPADVKGSRSVILDVCYTLDADGEFPGWQGPFSAGSTDTEPVATKRSMKFHESTSGAEIEMLHYASHDCSTSAAATVTTGASDDPADAWCQNGSSLSHGAIGTAGNAVAQLKTAVNYLTVRRHTDDTGAMGDLIGSPGSCLGLANTVTSTHLDHFVVHTNTDGGPGTDFATGCHQTVVAVTGDDANSYAWWCDTSDYSINYAAFDDNACGTQTANTHLKFTKVAYNTCAEADDADADVVCDYAGPTTTIENASTFTYTDALTLVNGASGDFGGKCLISAVDVSWEILTDDTTWDSICSAAASSSDSDDSDSDSASGAGKIAATAAAAAAAAALLI